jgi:hypothetical protein
VLSVDVLNILAPLIAVLLTGAGTVGVWLAIRVGKNNQTVQNYQKAAESWQSRAEAAETAATQLRVENRALTGRVIDLEGQVKVLRDTLTGESSAGEQIRALTEAIREDVRLSREQLAAMAAQSDRWLDLAEQRGRPGRKDQASGT